MKILAIRLSALGDVVMTLPVLKSVAEHYPQDEIVLLSRGMVEPLFSLMPPGVSLHAVNTRNYRGLWGLWRLYRELKAGGFDAVADLHGVLRSRVISLFFKMGGVAVETINKGRKEHRRLVSRKRRVLRQLSTQQERYLRVFAALGRPAVMSQSALLPPAERTRGRVQIGIAPFAKHRQKVYPLEQMERVVEMLAAGGEADIWLFGSGREEGLVCSKWADRYTSVRSLVGKGGGLLGELRKIQTLDLMITMDSANMHLASIAGTRTLTFWGATHPYAGFAGWRAEGSGDLQIDLDCRPCSIFGSKACCNPDRLACLRRITPEQVVRAALAMISE